MLTEKGKLLIAVLIFVIGFGGLAVNQVQLSNRISVLESTKVIKEVIVATPVKPSPELTATPTATLKKAVLVPSTKVTGVLK